MIVPATVTKLYDGRYVADCELGAAEGPTFDDAIRAMQLLAWECGYERAVIQTDANGSDC